KGPVSRGLGRQGDHDARVPRMPLRSEKALRVFLVADAAAGDAGAQLQAELADLLRALPVEQVQQVQYVAHIAQCVSLRMAHRGKPQRRQVGLYLPKIHTSEAEVGYQVLGRTAIGRVHAVEYRGMTSLIIQHLPPQICQELYCSGKRLHSFYRENLKRQCTVY